VVAPLFEAQCYNLRVAGSIPDETIKFSVDQILPTALWPTQSLTEICTRNLLVGKGRPVRKSYTSASRLST
jgi:hypothetical protein